jgi:hypothetical protein
VCTWFFVGGYYLRTRLSRHAYPPFLLPPPLPNSFPALGSSSELKTTSVQDFVRESSLEILFGFPSKFGFEVGRSALSLWSADVTSTRYRTFAFACVFCRGLYPLGTWTPRRILLGGGGCSCFSLAVTRHNFSLHYFIWFCIILCFIESFIPLHLVVTHICHSCCICFSFVMNIHFLCCWLRGFPFLFVPHLEGNFPLLDPRLVRVHNKAQYHLQGFRKPP